MSKELEALEVLQNYITVNEPLETQYPYSKRLSAIRLALTPPTADEVCEALSEYFDRNVYYERRYFLYRKEFYNQPFIIAYKYKSGLVELTKNVLPPHLINLISRFYMGVV